MFYQILDGDMVVGYKLYPKPENELIWRKKVCPNCPYYYKNYKNSYQCDGTILTIRKKCVFNKNNS